MNARSMTVLTHRRPADTIGALRALIDAAVRAGVTLRLDRRRRASHDLAPGPGLELNAPVQDDVELCIVLGGDGTILEALRLYAGTSVPVFAVNFGEIGFLATVEPDELGEGIAPGAERRVRAAAAARDRARRTGRGSRRGGAGRAVGINDVAIHRKVGERVAEIAYALEGEIVGSVRCDGLVIATPAGSTGYNLANGGPVMAWGVEGFVVSFIAPHSLTARALVVAPGRPPDDPQPFARAARHRRGRPPAGEIPPGGAIDARFVDDGRHDRPAAGLLILSPPAREVRSAGQLRTRRAPGRLAPAGLRRARR